MILLDLQFMFLRDILLHIFIISKNMERKGISCCFNITIRLISRFVTSRCPSLSAFIVYSCTVYCICIAFVVPYVVLEF